jgi:Predicted signal transduction protein with a C-terminal ATPase domain
MEGCRLAPNAAVKKTGFIFRWIDKIPAPRLKVFHQLMILILIMILFFIIQGLTSIYINDTMQKSSLNIARISSDRFNNIIIVKTYVEIIEKEYIKALTGRGKIKYLINEAEVPGLPRIKGEMVPAVNALRYVAPGDSKQILTNIDHIERIISLPLSEENLASLKRELDSISIFIDAAANKSINASYEAITRSSNFSVSSKIVTVIIIVMAIAILGVIYIFMVARTITEPIKKLAAYAMEIAKGNFHTRELLIHSSDDLNILAFAFNKMTASIQNMIREITEKSNLERKLYEQEMQNLKISQQLNEARFLALQSQINPHFLFNTLNAVMRKSMFEKADGTTQLIQSLANIFRYNLESSYKEVLLEEELAVINEYVYIQKTRFGSRIGFDIISQEETRSILIPRFIIQPLVENAIIHGIEPKEAGGTVRIKVLKKDNAVLIKIIDNGIGISKDQISHILAGTDEPYLKGHTTGIGITNVRDRLILYYKDPNCFSLWSKLNFGTIITLKIISK